MLQVVAERRVRGAVERTYTLRLPAAQIGLDEAGAMTAAEHAHAFMAFTAGLLADFNRYLSAGPGWSATDSPLRDALVGWSRPSRTYRGKCIFACVVLLLRPIMAKWT